VPAWLFWLLIAVILAVAVLKHSDPDHQR